MKSMSSKKKKTEVQRILVKRQPAFVEFSWWHVLSANFSVPLHEREVIICAECQLPSHNLLDCPLTLFRFVKPCFRLKFINFFILDSVKLLFWTNYFLALSFGLLSKFNFISLRLKWPRAMSINLQICQMPTFYVRGYQKVRRLPSWDQNCLGCNTSSETLNNSKTSYFRLYNKFGYKCFKFLFFLAMVWPEGKTSNVGLWQEKSLD